MSVFEKLLDGQTKLAVVGLGYVGMPLLFGFAEHVQVIGFDISDEKVALCKFGPDSRPDFGKARRNDNILCTNREEDLREAQVIIVAVPTPVHKDNTPDMRILQSASELVGRNLQKGAIVAYESTVYPGATEEVCVPILEKASGLKAGVDFKVGYSPERINPGDKFNKLETIVKIVSGMDEETLAELRGIYGLVAKGGIHSVSAIKVAEAAKVAENSQRDTNIAFVNELAMMFHAMGIDTLEVIDAMNSKWNALGFTPGLVGGHCIGVDPHYLLHKAEEMGYTARIIGESRRLNDAVGPYIAREGIKLLSNQRLKIHPAFAHHPQRLTQRFFQSVGSNDAQIFIVYIKGVHSNLRTRRTCAECHKCSIVSKQLDTHLYNLRNTRCINHDVITFRMPL